MNDHALPVITMEPTMSPGELRCLWEQLEASTTYVEFGSGYSTAMALASKTQSVHVIESDPQWIRRLQIREDVTNGERSGRLVFHYINIGPVRQLGAPADVGTWPSWRRYYSHIWHALGDAVPEVVLVDGRFRVACALGAIRHLGPDTSIVIHDFNDRPAYHEVLQYADVIASVDTMVVLRPHATFDWPAMCDAAIRYSLDYR
jgi:hypothetical protein